MSDNTSPTEQEFDSSAGAGFGFVGITRAVMDGVSTEEPLFLWLLSSHALGVGGEQGGAVDWLKDQVALLSSHSSQLGALLRTRLQDSWAASIPMILLSGESEREITWRKYCGAYPAQSEAEAAVRDLLFQMISQNGRSLYDAEGLPASQGDGSPQYCVMVRLGQTVRRLRDTETSPDRKTLLADWREVLLDILKRMPARITRGVAPAWPVFEDLVLSLLYVADWLLEPDSRRIPDFVEDYKHRPDERLTANQLALCTALFGWLEGYSRIGHLVQERPWRALLARQGMTIAVGRASCHDGGPGLTDPVAFYATEDGTRTALRRFLYLAEVHREEAVTVRQYLDGPTRIWQTETISKVTHESAEYHLSGLERFRLDC